MPAVRVTVEIIDDNEDIVFAMINEREFNLGTKAPRVDKDPKEAVPNTMVFNEEEAYGQYAKAVSTVKEMFSGAASAISD